MAKMLALEKKIMLLLDESQLSNARVKTELNISDKDYQDIREKLFEKGLVTRYQCQGGGIKLTNKGRREVKDIPKKGKSGVKTESELHDGLTRYLIETSRDDETDVLVINTGIKSKRRGKWQNPDVTEIAIDHYHHLRKSEVRITTYEVKRWGYFDVQAVYEAASQKRFAHEAFVVLEWDRTVTFSLTDTTYKVDQIFRECQRYGVGLSTLEKHYETKYRLRPWLDPALWDPQLEDIENFLDHIFDKYPKEVDAYNELMDGK